MLDSFAGQCVVVMGLGRFGGGATVVQTLLRSGAHVRLTDMASAETLQGPLTPLLALPEGGNLELALGGHDFTALDGAAAVVVNPAVSTPWANPFLVEATARGIALTTEIELALRRVESLGCDRVIGVTGSAGKSTTCAMLHHLFSAHGVASVLGGNLGGSFLATNERELRQAEVVVVELSSFMLYWLDRSCGPRALCPSVGVLTSLSPNHLDWHETAEHYSTSKRVLREAVTAERFVAPIADDDIAAEIADDAWWADSVQLDAREHAQLRKAISLRLPGEHQVRNAVCALRAASIHLEQRPELRLKLMLSMAGALSDFRGLPHRLHPAGVVRGVRVFDDSKATTPQATLRAVRSFDDAARVHLIAGGYDKGADLSAIKALGDELAGLYAIGATASSLSGGQHAMQCETLGIAVNEAARRARDGDVLLLSPGCASWDQFTNYEERGREFVAAAHRVLGSAHS